MSDLDAHLQGLRQSVDTLGGAAPSAPAPARGAIVERSQPKDLADILERVLNTGIVIAGEIRIDLLDIELLTIKLRLVITSLDRAEEVGLDWWRSDPWYSSKAERRPPQSSGGRPGGQQSVRGSSGAIGEPSDSGRTRARGGSDATDGGQNDRGEHEQSGGNVSDFGASKSVYAEEVVAMSASSARPTSRRTERADGGGAGQKRAAGGKTSPQATRDGGQYDAERSSSTKKPTSRKSASRKPANKKAVSKRESDESASEGARPEKTVAKKATSKQSAAKRTATKKTAGKKSANKKRAAAKKRTASMKRKRTAAKRDTQEAVASTTT